MSIKTWKATTFLTLTALGITAAGITAYAATQGQLGSSSTASINISLTVLPKIQIKQLDDFQMSVHEDAASANVQQINTGCVVTNTQSGYYTLSATDANGQSTDGYYRLQNSKGSSVNYSISAGNINGSLQPITSQSVKLKADNQSANCVSGKNLQLKVQLAPNVHLTPGQYGDVVQLEVVPI